MAKQKMKTVDKSISQEELDNVVLPEEVEAKRMKDLKYQEKLERKAKKEEAEEEKAAIQEKIEAKKEANVEEGKHPKKAVRTRSKRYSTVRLLVDRTKSYPLILSVELVKKSSYSRFAGTVVADLVTKDSKLTANIKFPHSTGKSIRVAIATDELLTDIAAGKIDFDLLVTKPDMMPKLAKYARVLGPKGLMPNPKNQTITPDPEKRKQELEGGTISIKTEKKSPLMHIVIGKTDMPDKDLVENTEALIKALGPRKLVKLVLSATMSPGIKVDLTPYQAL